MSSNLYKAGWVVVQDDDKRVIDNNGLIEEKINAAMQLSAAGYDYGYEEEAVYEDDGFTGGLAAENVDALFESPGAGNVLRQASLEELEQLQAQIEAAQAELSELRAQADGMIEEAKSEIGAMQMRAYEEAKNQGYQEGERLGRAEGEAAKAEYQKKLKQLESEYQKKWEELEPDFIDTLTGIYEHIFKVDLSRYKGIVVSLLENVIHKSEGNRNFMIHVAKNDYENVAANKERLKQEAGGGTNVDVVEDITLKPTQCFIETENGIFDCGLDTQLKELERKLKLLSYEK